MDLYTTDGIKITLTTAQIKTVEKERHRREKACSSFRRILRYFGFTQMRGDKSAFVHKRGWYAEIQWQSNYYVVWLVGGGLKSSGFPGGWIYYEPKEVKEELERQNY